MIRLAFFPQQPVSSLRLACVASARTTALPVGQMRSCCSTTANPAKRFRISCIWTTNTIRGWHKTYLQDGWDALAYDGWKGGQSGMTQVQEVALCAWLEARFCLSKIEIRAHVAAECGLNYSHSGCIKLLARLGFEYRKPKPLPRVASAQMQTALIAFYERLMRELPADEAVYFADAVHPEYQTKPAFGWVNVGLNPAVLSTAGRGRVNIHGAVILRTSMHLLSSPQPLMGSVQPSF
jgi:transposase